MLTFILQLLIMGSFGTMVYLLAQTIPRIDDTPPKELEFREHWALKKIERIDKKIKTSTEKFLRRLGIILLRWENKINKKVTRLKEEAAREAENIAIIEESAHEETTAKKTITAETPKEETPEPPKPAKRTRKPRMKKTETSGSETLPQ